MSEQQTRSKQSSRTREAPPFHRTLWEDINSGEFKRSMRRDLTDVYHFYLDDEARKKLSEMSEVKKGLHLVYWLLKSSVLKLTAVRRVLLLASLVLFAAGFLGFIGWGWPIFAFALLLFVLLLELKDKLLAQDELASGRAVQFALMPTENPQIRGWETWLYTHPANDVGGDLVDYLAVDDSRLGVSLGDVAGKGLPAALFMAKLQSTLRAIAPKCASPAELGAEINAIFRRDGLPDRFASLVYVEVEREGCGIRVLNAGHFPPIVIGALGIRELPKGGPALGLMPDVQFAEHYAELDPNDLLLVYSDGLTEARNETGEFFDSPRLMQLLPELRGLSAETAGSRILSEVARFVGDARPHDDLSLVLLKRLPPSRVTIDSPAKYRAAVVESHAAPIDS